MADVARPVAVEPDLDEQIAHLLVFLQQDLEPSDRATILADYGRRLNRLGRFAQGRAALEEAAELAPENPDVLRSLGLAIFGEGNWAEGLSIYDKVRWQLDRFEKYRRAFPHPPWQGEPINGKRLLLWTEQGVGDQAMQARVLGPLLEQGAEITIESDPRMHPLIRRTWPDVRCETQTVNLPKSLVSDSFDYQASMLTAWRWADLPQPQPAYLAANETLVRAFRDVWAQQGWSCNIGLSWRSGSGETGARRSLPEELLRPILHGKGATFHALQYDADPEEVASLSRRLGRPIYSDRDGDPMKDLDRQAAQIAALDLVISIDNTTVHLAGAVGTDCWVLLPVGSDWRWGDGGDATPLYESLHLFRNDQIGHWSGVVVDLVEALRDWSRARASTM